MKVTRTALSLAGVLALAACSDTGPTAARSPEAAPLHSAGDRAIDGSYIVVLNEDADPRSVAAVAGVSPRYVYTAALNGFAAELNQGQLNALLHNPNVASVEEDQVAEATTTQSSATWGLDRIDQRARPLSGTYTYTGTGSSVYAYIIDTGIYTAHSNFGGRAAVSYDALGGNGQDCNGHGTHVAGTVGSATYGVAKGVRLRAVRVLDCQGSGSFSGIIAGIDWVRVNRTNPAVANLSLGGGYSSSLNTAITNLANSGVFVAVAAGNENQNACNVSPASASAVTTVASSTSGDAKSSFSNYGSCVDVYAPGSSITSTWNNGGTNTISGTSMASPHVAGVAALYKGTYGNASQSTIDSWIKSNATANVITGNVSGTPNLLLYKAGL
ncbi:MAG TPA: S8 family peptidase [Longimicrobium sp.]|jgi:subtilisin family serine protease|uniref:S8 family peptidase n=1 Tax=Longimicrobium sp. TaxID=2029185 RepID=UPI002ED91084